MIMKGWGSRMIWALLTVVFYSLTAYGDKYISSKLKCTPGEYTFLVSMVTVFWLLLCLPVTGWQIRFNRYSVFLLVCLVIWKIVEFYTTAMLLKHMEPYELRAWLGINVAFSYGINLLEGKSNFRISILVLVLCLLMGIYLILTAQAERKLTRSILVCLLYIASKFMYGLQMGYMVSYGNSTTILILVLTIVAVIQLPHLSKKILPDKKKMFGVAMSRLTNAAGLMTEAEAATANIFFYTLVQPIQLFVLFVVCLITRKPMSRRKQAGSVLCVVAVFLMTIALTYS